MLTVNINRIIKYSQCPKRCEFEWHVQEEIDVEERIIQDVVKGMYLQHTRDRKPISWKQVLLHTERRLVSKMPDLVPRQQYRETKGYLERLSNWYSDYYLKDYAYPGLTNVPISIRLDNFVVFEDSIDIVVPGDNIKLFDFRKTEEIKSHASIHVHNDLAAQTVAWAFWKAAEVLPKEYVRMVIGPRSLRPVRSFITEGRLKKVEGIIRQILRGMKDGIYYPAVSEQCDSCPHRSYCCI